MYDSFIRGALAGYAIALPVGAIAILVLETGLRHSFWHVLAAASGAASADLLYATIAATVGTFVAVWLEPIAPVLKIASTAVLVALGARGLYRTWVAHRKEKRVNGKAINASLPQTYITLLGLTILNPATIAYFTALILGETVGTAPSAVEKASFVFGAFLASWSWKIVLAAMSTLAHRH